LHKVNKYCPNVHFEVVTIEEAKKLKV
jgi:hypothetical protein